MQTSAILLLLSLLVGRILAHAAAQPQEDASSERTLRAHSLAMEAEYLRLHENMSMKNPKTKSGKGKGDATKSSKSKNSPKDDKKKKCKSVSSKKSKTGKGKGKVKGKGKGKGKGDDCDEETRSPSGSSAPSTSSSPSASDAPSGVPTLTSTPTISRVPSVPMPTNPPNRNDVNVTLVPYFVSYQIEQTRIPSNDDYAELTAFTDDYLNKYFQVIFRETPEAVYVSSATALAGSQFRLGEPVQVDYNTTLSFAAISMQIPDGKELDMLLASAFEGANGIVYTSALAVGLDPSNIFVTTSAVTFNSVPQIAPQSDSGRRVGIAAGSAALAFVTMISGLALYFRRHEYEQVGSTKNLMGHMTVDGDTYTGDEKTLDSLPHVPTKYRFDGGSSQAPSTVEWGEYPEDVVANTSNFRVQSTEYESEGEEGSDETEDDEKKEETVPEVRQQRLDDVSL